MIVNDELLNRIKNLAQDNYETWGQYIVECYTDEELKESLVDYDTLEEWVEIRKRVAEIYEERLSSKY
jgi:hypothetical protein